MENIIQISQEIGCLAALLLSIRYTLHMFQLNSYQYKSHWRFLRTHLWGSLLPLIGIALAVGTLAGERASANGGGLPSVAVGVLGLLYSIVLCVLFFPRKAKKKLVYTARVKRLLVTTLLALLLLTVTALLVGLPIEGALLLGTALAQYLVLLANLLNRPIELRINRHYVEDAKAMLKSCPNLKIIGITGSYGKTSVKYYLYSLLSVGFDVLMTPESYNTPMGIVKTIRGSLRATHEIFLCEMGARHVGDIKEICDIVEPGMGIITSLGYQHLETFHSLDNVVHTKQELFDALPWGAARYINGDNEIARQYDLTEDSVTYGISPDNDYRAFDLRYSEKGSVFKVQAPDGSVAEYTTRMLGEHNVVNITGAIAIAHDMGIPLEKLKLAVYALEGAPHRLQPIPKNEKLLIIDDAYNSNPNGTKAALKTLAMFDGLKILVTPGMVELGEEQDKYNYEFGADAGAVCDYIVLVGKKQTESIQRGVRSTAFCAERLYVADNLQDALEYVYGIKTDKKRIVLLENDLPDNY